MLDTLDEVTFELGTIRPGFLSLSVLFVIFPISFVPRSVGVSVDTVTVSLVVFPISLIDITISMDEFSFSTSFVLFSHAFVD